MKYPTASYTFKGTRGKQSRFFFVGCCYAALSSLRGAWHDSKPVYEKSYDFSWSLLPECIVVMSVISIDVHGGASRPWFTMVKLLHHYHLVMNYHSQTLNTCNYFMLDNGEKNSEISKILRFYCLAEKRCLALKQISWDGLNLCNIIHLWHAIDYYWKSLSVYSITKQEASAVNTHIMEYSSF